MPSVGESIPRPKPRGSAPQRLPRWDKLRFMRRLFPLIVLALLAAGHPLSAQAPGEFPHLVLDDKMGTIEPGGGLGPFDNTGTFGIAAGQSLEARVSYDSLGQTNDNVLWGLLVSGTQTPFPTTGTPEPLLLTMPPFILITPALPTLQLQPDMSGLGVMPLFVPPGIVAIETYVQGLIFDITSPANLRLSNGLTVQITTPDYNVHVAWVQNAADGSEAFLRNVGNTDIDANTLKTLAPLGPLDAPLPDDGVGPPLQVDDFKFLPILPNVGDEPINPLARPLTTIRGAVDSVTSTIPVYDTTGFPERGRLLVAFGQSNLWANKTGGGFASPGAEVIHYDGKTEDEFLNCQRSMIGSTGPDTLFPHGDGETVLGFFTMATTAGARGRTRVGLDADNVDMPHVVIPPFTVDEEGGGPVTMDLDLYLYETKVNKIQGFAVFDRVTGQWREIPGTAQNEVQGRWDPMVHVAPDGRSIVAALKRPGGLHGWDNLVDNLVAIRLDETNWKATGTPYWSITFQVGPDPPTILTTNVRSREIYMPSVAIVGPDDDNYVMFAGLKHKWQQNPANPGSNFVSFQGFESEYVNEEVLVRDYIDVPLVMQSSAKSPPVEPRLYVTTDFGSTGLLNTIIRFDPQVLASPMHEELLITAGSEEKEEDVYLVKDVSVTAGGDALRAIVNLSGYNNGALSVGQTRVRPFSPGGHGQGRKAAFSNDGSIVAWLAEDSGKIRDWVDVGLTSGASSGKVGHTYQDAGGVFQEVGELRNERVVSGLRWLDNERVAFLMGRQRYSDPIAANPANIQAMDLFAFDTVTEQMTNLTATEDSGDGFSDLGKINPVGFFAAADGSFSYFIRAGGISDVGGSVLAADTPVTNLVGLNATTLNVFNATGDEFTGSSPISNLHVPDDELGTPTESPMAMRFTEGYGQQDGLVYFTAHRVGGNGADDVMAFHREIPFIAFEVTNVSDAGSHITNLVPNPFGNTVAYARTQGTDRFAADQHPFVVDLNNFLFVRDLAPALLDGSNNFLGRVMDGSLQFVPPSGNASDALVLSMGFFTHPNGISFTATPVYYSLASVSDTAAEPIPLLIPLLTTAGLVGTPWRFYVPFAGLSQAP